MVEEWKKEISQEELDKLLDSMNDEQKNQFIEELFKNLEGEEGKIEKLKLRWKVNDKMICLVQEYRWTFFLTPVLQFLIKFSYRLRKWRKND